MNNSVLIDNIPTELRILPSWVAWRAEQKPGQTKIAKVPYRPTTGQRADSSRPETGATFEQAVEAYQRGGYSGIGVILAEGYGIVGVDLDNCVDGVTIAPWAAEIVAELASYTEVSPSGTGLRIFCKGKLPPGRRKKGPVEMYETERFLTMTGRSLELASPLAERQAQIEAIHAKHLGSTDTPTADATVAGPGNSLTVEQAVALCVARFQNFKELWEGALLEHYSRSEAEMAVMNRLAWATGGDPEKMMEAFRESGHYESKCERTCPKYTIPQAIAAQNGRFYQSAADAFSTIPAAVPGAPSPAQPAQNGTGFRLLSIKEVLHSPRSEEWLVKGLLPRRGLAQIYGAPKAGKSFVCIDIAACVALGLPWHGRKVRQAPVVYVAGEGHRGLRKRFEAWALFNGHSLDDAPIAVSATSVPLDDSLAAQEVTRAIAEASAAWGRGPALVVVDTVARCMTGDENSSRDMSAFIRSVDRCLGEDVLRLLVHHVGHGAKDRARGSSSLPAALDACFRLERGQNGVTLSCDFLKDGASPSPLAWLWRDVEIWRGKIDGEDETITSLALDPVGVERVAPRKSALNEKQIQVLDLLRSLEGGQEGVDLKRLQKTAIDQGIYARSDIVSRALSVLVEKGHVARTGEVLTCLP